MSMVFGALAVEGASWTHPHNIPLMVANTVSHSLRIEYKVGFHEILSCGISVLFS